ncbi:MAG: serine/threonine-protein kinase [Byssovorax sp.]
MATCPTCRATYPNDHKICSVDGATLLPDEAFSGADPDLAAGIQVGEYIIEGKIGEGGFGSVYRAVHPLIGKAAAIKVLNRQYSSNPQMVSRFIAEARAVNQIRNRNIIDIFSFGMLEDGRQYYVMELLDGITFDGYLKQKGRLAPEDAMPILRGIARALGAAHAAGIAHRDLKPENVFLVMEDDGGVFPKLLDFGIAKLMGESGLGHKTRTGAPMGTPHYMSPEQCRGRNVDQRTDIYSFGIVVFETLTGRLPFDGEDVMDLLLKQTSAPAPRISEVCPDLPAALDNPVLHMLEKDPANRPESLMAGLDALAAAAQSAGFDVKTAPRKQPDPLPPGTGPVRTGVGHSLTPAEQEISGARTMLQGAETKPTLPAATAPAAMSRAPLFVGGGVAAAFAIVAAIVLLRPPAPPQQPLTVTVPQPTLVVAPSAPTVVTPVATVVPAPVGLPAEAEITVDSTPKEVEIYLGKDRLGTSAKPLHLKRSDDRVKLTFKAAGYAPQDLEIAPSADSHVAISLVKLGVGAKKKPGGGDLEY